MIQKGQQHTRFERESHACSSTRQQTWLPTTCPTPPTDQLSDQLALLSHLTHSLLRDAFPPACDRSRYLSPCSQSENGVPTAPAFPRVSASWTKSAIHAIAGGSGFPSHSFHKCNLWQPSLAQPTLASASLPAAEGLELCRHMASSYLIPLDIRAQMYTMYCMAVCKPSTKHRPSSVYGKRRTASTVVAPRRLASFHVNIPS